MIKTFELPIEGKKIRVACLKDGIVQTIIVVDSAHLDSVQKLYKYDGMIEVDTSTRCDAGWRYDATDETFTASEPEPELTEPA